jgi:membrane protease YdiL (CAAX protease family)/tRNA A-37 threonylcarbamoyl transferase component Bud32
MKRLAWFMTLAVLLMGIGLLISTAAAVWLADWARGSDAEWAVRLASRPDRVMRRVLMVWGIAVLFGLARGFGWKGWRDCGWEDEAGPRAHGGLGGLLGRGLAIGLLTMGVVRASAIGLGFHSLSPLGETGFETAWQMFSFLVSAAVVGVVEETVCRGILYRVLARNTGAVTGALISSGIFALAHFVSPPESAFQVPGGWWARSLGVARAALAAVPEDEAFGVRFLNLALIGVAMCGLLVRTGSVWMSVACHGAWVWVIKTCHHLTDYAPAPAWTWVLGRRPDATDSPAIAVMLAGLALWGFAGRRGRDAAVVVGGRTWWTTPGEAGHLAAWLARHTAGGRLSDGVTLKVHAGCAVGVADGVVFKRRAPKSVWHALRSWITPCRARRAYRVGLRLAAAGVPVAEPLAWAAWREGMGRVEGLLTRELSGAEPLDRFLRQVCEDPDKRREILKGYAELMAAFHRVGFSNRDLKDENVLCSQARPFRLWAVDLDGTRPRWRLTRRRAGRDLYRVGRSLKACGCAEPEDVRGFFQVYNRLVPRLARDAFPE